MRAIVCLIALCAVVIGSTTVCRAQTDELATLRVRRAGEVVSDSAIAEFGIDRCFTSSTIDAAIFARIDGKSYKKECTLPLSELRYLRVLHRNLAGETMLGEMICNKAIADDLLAIFRTLYQARYPIERMVLVDEYDASDTRSMQADNSSSFNFRTVPGSTVMSKHSLGMAVDINPLYNPYVRARGGRISVDPAEGAPYVDRSQDFRCKIDHNDLCYKEFTKRGFVWGGDWKNVKDYQHFEKVQ